MAIEDGGAMKKEPITMQTNTQPMDLRDWGYAPGHYTIKCRDCTEAALHNGASKHSWRCKDCATKAREASLAAAKSPAVQPVDIVQCLRDFEGSDALGNGDFSICRAAATEIEALRARCEAMEAKLSVYEAPSQTSGIGAGHVLYTLADAPTHDIANNGELHTLRCRICGVTGKQLHHAICTEAVARAALGDAK
jgi:hypothetical protein